MVVEFLHHHKSSGDTDKYKKKFSQLTELEKKTRRILEYWTPKDREAWLDVLVKIVKDKVCLKYTTDRDLRTVIDAARRTIGKRFERIPAPHDKDFPDCYYWNEIQVGNWITENGYPQLREAFLINHISGRKLIAVDASALSKMGLKYFDEIKEVAAKIRQLLGIPRPNMMRALHRLVPLELCLREKLPSGRTYDLLTFEKFCQKHGFPYDYLVQTNKTGMIPCTMKLMLYFDGSTETPEGSDESSEDLSLVDAPTVEFVTRRIIIRNRILDQIFNELLTNVCTPTNLRKSGLAMSSLSMLLNNGMKNLGLTDSSIYGKERLEFVSEIGKSLIKEMLKTAEILRDIQSTQNYLKTNVSEEEYEVMKSTADIFVEDVLPIAALLSLGELDLDVIFGQEPEFHQFVNEIVTESEQLTNELVPESSDFIDHIINEAKMRVVSMLYPELPEYTLRSASATVTNLLDDLIETAIIYPEKLEEFHKTNQLLSAKRKSESKDLHFKKEFPLVTHSNVQLLQDWKKMKIPRIPVPHKEKFDLKGSPILAKLDSQELLHIIETGKIPVYSGDTKDGGKNWIAKAKEEIQRRQQENLKAVAEQQTLRRKYPGKTDPQGQFQEYTIEEKFDQRGNPILYRLNDLELAQIIEKGAVTAEIGEESEGLPFRKLSLPWLVRAKTELAKRGREEGHTTAQLDNYHRQYPGIFDKDGTYHEFFQNEKVGDENLPIVERLTTEELDNLIETGIFEGRPITLPADKKNKLISRAQVEKHKRQMEDLKAVVEQGSYRRRYPGRVDDLGTYHEYTLDEKFDPDQSAPHLDRLTTDELEAIIQFGTMELPDGVKFLNSEVIAKAKMEKRKRDNTEKADERNVEIYRTKFPGKIDDEEKFHEYSLDEKYDGQALPIIERLNVFELNHLIRTGEFNGVKLPESHKAHLMELARIEMHVRDQTEIQAQIEQDLHEKMYPGKMVDGVFTEFTKEEKFNQDPDSPLHNLPIVERLDDDELDEIVKTGHVTTADGKRVTNKEILRMAKAEQEKRMEEEEQTIIQQKILRMRPTMMKIQLTEERQKEVKGEEKFDAMGKPIVERLTVEELDEIIREGDSVQTQTTGPGAGAKGQAIPAKGLLGKRPEGQRRKKTVVITTPGKTGVDIKGPAEKLAQEIQEFDDSSLQTKEAGDEAVEEEEEEEEEIPRPRQDLTVVQAKAEKKRRAQKAAELKEAEEYILKYPKLGGFKMESLVMGKRPNLEDYMSKFDEDSQQVEHAKKEKLRKLLSQQMRMEALEALHDMEERKRLEEDRKFFEDRATNTGTISKTEDNQIIPAVASLALFNGFVIDDLAQVVGTADLFDGKVRNQDGEVIGMINSQGILFANDGHLMGKIGADVEQIGVGKFRAMPRNVDSLESSRAQGATTSTTVESPDGHQEDKLLPRWNADQATVKGGLLMQKGDEWIRQTNYTPSSEAANTRLALQIQMTEGYKPSQVILLDSKSIAQLRDELRHLEEDLSEEDDEELAKMRETLDEEDYKTFVWKRVEKKKKKKAQMAKPLTARMLKGDTVDLNLVKKDDLIAVPIPGSTGKWGVQEPPPDQPEAHEFKPPHPTSQVKSDPVVAKGTNILAKVQTGEAKKLVNADGTAIGEIRKDGQIYAGNGDYVGYVQNNGIIVKADGTPMKDEGLKIIRQNGVVVGQVNDKGKLALTKDTDRFLIGMIWADGRIVTLENVLVGIVTKDGRILGAGGKAIGLFTPTWEILGTDGIPFAYVTAEGRVYRYDVIPQTRYIPRVSRTDSLKTEAEAVVLFTNENNLAAAFEVPPSPAEESTNNFDNQPSIMTQHSSRITEDYDALAAREAREKARRLEEERRQYDLDESHKRAKPKEPTPPTPNPPTPQSAGVKTPGDKKQGVEVHSHHDHTVATVDEKYLKEKQLKQQQMVDNWANQVALGNTAQRTFNVFDPEMAEEDRQRVATGAADTIIDDIFKLALTHLLLQAEAGYNTKKIMQCLAEIQTTGGNNDEHTQAMWNARLSQVGAALKVFKSAASMLPTKQDKPRILQLVQKLGLMHSRQMSKAGHAADRKDKGIQHDAKVDVGVTADIKTLLKPPVQLPLPPTLPEPKIKQTTLEQDLQLTARKSRHHHHKSHHHHHQNQEGPPVEDVMMHQRLPHTPARHALQAPKPSRPPEIRHDVAGGRRGQPGILQEARHDPTSYPAGYKSQPGHRGTLDNGQPGRRGTINRDKGHPIDDRYHETPGQRNNPAGGHREGGVLVRPPQTRRRISGNPIG